MARIWGTLVVDPPIMLLLWRGPNKIQ